MAAAKGGNNPEPFRIEADSLGQVSVPAEHLWGAQTQRARLNFPIHTDGFTWGRAVIRAFGVLKKSAALVNQQLGLIPADKARYIAAAAAEVAEGTWDHEFPLTAFQSGSGTQSNMNANEVIANRAIQLAGGEVGTKTPIHPNDHVNLGQSSNDAFPTVMHMAIVDQLDESLIPAVQHLRATFSSKSDEFNDVVMLGRTHLQDATPITLGQIISGWAEQLSQVVATIGTAVTGLLPLAIGGTAVGTGVNTHSQFGELVSKRIAAETGKPFVSAQNRFAVLSAHDAVVTASAALRTLAVALMKIANDLRWYASGPRAGLAELRIPENEPGSSIMPGKVNPTQCEMLTMLAAQVFGNDHTVAFAGSQGNFQLNVYKTIILHNVLESIQLLTQGCRSFDTRCAVGIEPDRKQIQSHLENSLMLVTALSPKIGYENAAKIARTAHLEGLTLRESAHRLALISPEQFDEWVRPLDMTRPHGS